MLKLTLRNSWYRNCLQFSRQNVAKFSQEASPFRTIISAENIVSINATADVPKADINLFSYVTENFDKFGDSPALIKDVTGEVTSYTTLMSNFRKFGSALRKQGFSKGDVLAVLSPNCPEYIYPLCTPAALGGTVTTVNPGGKANEITTQLVSSKTSVLFADSSNASLALQCAKTAGISKVIINDLDTGFDSSNIIKLSEMLSDGGDAFPSIVPVAKDDDVAVLPYSSGTTGLPKGVMLTHHNIAVNINQTAVLVPTFNNHLAYLPYYHMYALGVGLLENLRFGRTIVSQGGFEPERFLSNIQNYKIEDLDMVPPIVLFLLKHPLVEKYDLTSMKGVTIGAAPCGRDMYDQFQAKFPHVEYLLQGFGMTELSPVACLQTTGYKTFGSVGIPLPLTEMKVTDTETGANLKAGETGEICIRGPQVMAGYWNNEEATRNTIKDGWLHSGDIGYFDEDGQFFIVDRLKELIKYKGYQVPPAELENLLIAHPSIVDAAVIGIPDEAAGELPKAFVVKSPDVALTEEDVSAYIEENVSTHKKLRGGVQFIDSIPKSPSGKILRRALKEL